MEDNNSPKGISFMERLGLAFRLVFSGEFASRVAAALTTAQKAKAPAVPAARTTMPPERQHAAGLLVLSALQREGRLVDFLQQDIAGFSDEEIGAAARVVHGGCRRVLREYLVLEPSLPDGEGATVTVPKGFDAQRTRLTGNVSGEPPFRGVLKHHGWVAKEVRLPAVSEAMDPRVIAPAEVEIGQ
jgi:hypothetical protein